MKLLTHPIMSPHQATAAGLLITSMLCLAATNRPPQNSTQARADYSEFKIIPDRNIFNPKRSPGRTYNQTPRDTARRTYTRSESFALVGTMSYAKGPYAFFESSTTQYRKVVSANDKIADCKVLLVDPNFVKLEVGTNIVDLPVGKQMQRQDGTWRVADRIETYDSRSSYASRSSSGSDYGGRDRSDRRDSRSGERDFGRGGSTAPTTPWQPGLPGGLSLGLSGQPGGTGGEAPPIIVINGGEMPDAQPPGNEPPSGEAPPVGGAPATGLSQPAAPTGGSANDILEQIRQRVARERGE